MDENVDTHHEYHPPGATFTSSLDSSSHASRHGVHQSERGAQQSQSSPSTQYSTSQEVLHAPKPSDARELKAPSIESSYTSHPRNIGPSMLTKSTESCAMAPAAVDASKAQHLSMVLCCLWRIVNPNATLDEKKRYWLGKACGRHLEEGLPSGSWQATDASFQQAGCPGMTPIYVKDAVGSLWQSIHPDRKPDNETLASVSSLFDIQMEELRAWFTNSMTEDSVYGSNNHTSDIADDSAYGSNETTPVMILNDLTADEQRLINGPIFQHQGNSRHCTQHNKRQCDRHGNGFSPRRDHEVPVQYICTIGCGKSFRTKDTWRNHERKSWGQELYICRVPYCRNTQQESPQWVYKDGLRAHQNTKHKDMPSQALQMERIPIPGNFRRLCVFWECDYAIKDFIDQINHIGAHYETGDWAELNWREAFGYHAPHPGKCQGFTSKKWLRSLIYPSESPAESSNRITHPRTVERR